MKNFKAWEEAAKLKEELPATSTADVAMPADVQADKARKKKKSVYDGRTREAKKFIERIIARRNMQK